jgi:hypothetical protein
MTNVVPLPDRAVYVCEPIVSNGGLVIIGWIPGEIKLVFPLMARAVAPCAREMVVPETTIDPPAVSNIEPIRYAVPVPGSGLKVACPIVKGGAVISGAAGVAKTEVTPLITTRDAD